MDPVQDQIVSTLHNMRREIVMYGVTPEADTLWQHAMELHRMRRKSPRPVVNTTDHGLPAFLRKQAD